MKTVCSDSMPFAREAFETLGDVIMLEGRSICARDVKDADLLAIRSTTRVTAQLLEGSRVKFVGTATIGTDHMDLNYLREQGITWCHAPGCNATSVSEYVTAALLCLAERRGLVLEGKTIGIVGVGNVGGRVVLKAQALGLRILANDPPRRRIEGDEVFVETDAGRVATDLRFVPLEQVLDEADIVTLHVPLTREGPDRTFRMAGGEFFSRLKPGCIFINSARGAVMDTDALIRAIESGAVAHAVVDTWEDEPAYSAALLDLADIGTPHIAGYSFDGKVRGTAMVYEAACRFLDRPVAWKAGDAVAAAEAPVPTVDAAERTDEQALGEIVRTVYDISADDLDLRATLDADARVRSEGFDRLRRNYPVRREFPFAAVRLLNAAPSLREKAALLGFALA